MGLVHRDIKPGNVMMTKRGVVKVMDFGIARAMQSGVTSMTQTGMVVGTPQYLSPEQALGRGVDARSDLYSVGIMLFELLTGRLPFDADSPLAIAYAHVQEEPRRPVLDQPSLPPGRGRAGRPGAEEEPERALPDRRGDARRVHPHRRLRRGLGRGSADHQRRSRGAERRRRRLGGLPAGQRRGHPAARRRAAAVPGSSSTGGFGPSTPPPPSQTPMGQYAPGSPLRAQQGGAHTPPPYTLSPVALPGGGGGGKNNTGAMVGAASVAVVAVIAVIIAIVVTRGRRRRRPRSRTTSPPPPPRPPDPVEPSTEPSDDGGGEEDGELQARGQVEDDRVHAVHERLRQLHRQGQEDRAGLHVQEPRVGEEVHPRGGLEARRGRPPRTRTSGARTWSWSSPPRGSTRSTRRRTRSS